MTLHDSHESSVPSRIDFSRVGLSQRRFSSFGQSHDSVGQLVVRELASPTIRPDYGYGILWERPGGRLPHFELPPGEKWERDGSFHEVRDEDILEIVETPRQRSRFSARAAAVMLVALAMLCLRVVWLHGPPSRSVIGASTGLHPVATREPVSSLQPSPAVAPSWTPIAATAPAREVPSVSFESLPPAMGRIRLAESSTYHRLFVDGRLAQRGAAIVPSGPHMIQGGGQGAARRIVVPWDHEIIVGE